MRSVKATSYKSIKNVLLALTILYDGKINLATVDVDHMFQKVKIKSLVEMARHEWKKLCEIIAIK